MVRFYDYPAFASSIVLRNPELGDTQEQNTQIVERRTRSGNLHTYKKTPVYEKLVLSFKSQPIAGCGELSALAAVKTFLNTYAGLQLKYIDYNSVQRIVVITQNVSYKIGKTTFEFDLTLEVVG